MPEEETKTEEEEEIEGEEADMASPSKMITEANKAAKRLEAANQTQEKLIQRQERLLVESKLGGRSQGGIPPVEPKVDTDEEFADKVLRGEVTAEDLFK